jgi:hypothetical protein
MSTVSQDRGFDIDPLPGDYDIVIYSAARDPWQAGEH